MGLSKRNSPGEPGPEKRWAGGNSGNDSNPSDRLLPRLEKVKATGPDQWIACCPAHADRSPSLSIKQVDDRILIHCFAGCPASDVVAAVGLSLSDLFDKPLDHHRAPLKPYQRQRQGQAFEALQSLRVEALVVLIAADRMAAGHGLPWNDLDRLHQAFERILETCTVVGAKPKIPNHCPELKQPSEFTDQIIEEIHGRQNAGEVSA